MGKRILLVDDEPLILKGLKYTLEQDGYETDTAVDGQEALDKFFSGVYDLVLLDVMLPKVDGLSVCQRIRETSSVPIIMLTAKGEDMDKILGLEYGADDYMTKPFNPELLQTVVGNLLTSRSKLREMLLSGTGKPCSEPESAEESGEIRLSAADRAFVDKLRQYVDAHISDCSLNISDISTEMCMSRASFFRKIKSLTGVTPNNFILIYRLNRAAEMIRSREYRLNEVSDLLGFSSKSHFSRCFKQHFGITPKDYGARGVA